MKSFGVVMALIAICMALGYQFYVLTGTNGQFKDLETSMKITQQSLQELPNAADLSSVESRSMQIKNDIDAFKTELIQNLASLSEGNEALRQTNTMLEGRLTLLEHQIAAMKQERKAASQPVKPDAASKSDPTRPAQSRPSEKPSFEVLGTEVRGKELFLVAIPKDAMSLNQTRLFRANDNIDGYWRLKTLTESNAVFVNTAGEMVNIAIEPR